ncbi:MAG: alpha/beta fold hydrolase [Flavisolibacter sp.]
MTSQAQKMISGHWEGKLGEAGGLRIIFNIQQQGHVYSTEIDSPDQGVKGIKTASTLYKQDSILISIPQANALFAGKLKDDTTIIGNWTQGITTSLQLKKVAHPTLINRPQTPTPPFPYRSEEVIYFNADKSQQYGATLTIPKGKGPFPAALLITGSGQQNRDEEILGHKPFAVIADFLTTKGYIVLRVDDRGMGKSNGNFQLATTLDFRNDAKVGLIYLLDRKEVNKSKVGLIGHSEGGLIAEMVAAEKKEIDFIVLLAAPGEKILELMKHQNAAIARTVGLGKSYIERYLQLYEALILGILKSDGKQSYQVAEDVLNKWISDTPNDIVIASTAIRDETSKKNFLNAFLGQINTPWYRYFLGLDPQVYLQKITAKVLALNGDKDIQVIAEPNLSAIKTALDKSPSKEFEIKQIKGVNHLFQHCKICNLTEYGQLEETIAPEVLQTIHQWLDQNVK